MAHERQAEQLTTPIDDREDRHDEFASDSKKCPECGEPIENVRATCPKCGYEYSGQDYDDPDAGKGFVAGTQVDEQGNEIEQATAEQGAEPEQPPLLEPEDDDEDTSSSSSSSDEGAPGGGA